MANNAFQENMSIRFRRLLSGDPQGIPPWLDVIQNGETPGYFLPSDAPWVVHAGLGTLVGGIRALLMQALHPGTLRGVSEHSRYESDPLGRLAGTIRWLTVTTFGSKEAIDGEAARVNRLHQRVTGDYKTNASESKNYRASDHDLMLWVHICFMESFIVSHLSYTDIPVPGGTDEYIRQWARAAEPLGLTRDVPKSSQELDEMISSFYNENQLRVDEDTRKVIGFIKNPPLPALAKPIYKILYHAAASTLKDEFRQMLGIKTLPNWIIKPLTKNLLKLIGLIIGPDSPIEEAARSRIARTQATSA